MEKLLGEKQPRKAVSLFGKYRLLRPLKRSPFLENYLAQAESPPHTMLVLKRLHPLVIHRTDWVALFLDEVKQAATLWHPNISRIYDLGEIDGIPYFVHPYLFGKKMQTLLARSRSLPIPTGMALLLFRQLLEALDFAHGMRGRSGKPMAHGGLHPERIFIGYDGMIRVGDFGLGWLEDPRSAIRSRYRAPESISERKGGELAEGTPREDLFAASAILCELLGEFPEPVKPGTEPWGYLPAAVRSILVRGLAIDPTARFQTAREMVEPIESILENEYPRLNLSNYIQAFFGKEIEVERQAFARFAPAEEGRSSSGESVLFERMDLPPVVLIPPAAPPSPLIPPDPLQELPMESHAAPAVIATVPIPASSAPPAGTEAPSEIPLEKKASPWQPVWWSLFGLLMTGFVGVLFFSLYRSSPDKRVSSSPPTALPTPTIEASEAPRDSMDSPSMTEQGVEVKEQPALPEPPSPAEAPAALVKIIKEPSSSVEKPVEKPKRGRIKNPAGSPLPQNDPPSISASAATEQAAPPDAALVAAKRTAPKLREETPPQPKVEEIPFRLKTNEEMLSELIERQRRAFQNQDGALYVQDLADGKGGFEHQVADLFGGARPIRVEFEVFELKVRGEEADISVMQTARLQRGKTTSVQKTLLFWKLKKEKDRWKIEKFNIIEKYPALDVG